MASHRADPWFHQSGNDTQFLFSEGDVRESDADALAVQPAAGRFIIPNPLSFCE